MAQAPFVPVGGIDAMVEYPQDGATFKVSRTFYRGESANRSPNDASLDTADVIPTYMVKGLVPSAPMIGPETVTVAFGSCFARYLADHLNGIGYHIATRRDSQAYISNMGDGIVHTYAIRQQFEWAWENRVPTVELWHGYRGEEFGYDSSVRLKTKEIFDAADVFILTLGLSEVWYDEPTGEVFWRAVPSDRSTPVVISLGWPHMRRIWPISTRSMI